MILKGRKEYFVQMNEVFIKTSIPLPDGMQFIETDEYKARRFDITSKWGYYFHFEEIDGDVIVSVKEIELPLIGEVKERDHSGDNLFPYRKKEREVNPSDVMRGHM